MQEIIQEIRIQSKAAKATWDNYKVERDCFLKNDKDDFMYQFKCFEEGNKVRVVQLDVDWGETDNVLVLDKEEYKFWSLYGLEWMNDEAEHEELAYEAYFEFQKEIEQENQKILGQLEQELPKEFFDSIQKVIEETTEYFVPTPMKIVKEPRGEEQSEDTGTIKTIWVDQRSVGDSGDSYEGFVYVKLEENRFLQIPFSC